MAEAAESGLVRGLRAAFVQRYGQEPRVFFAPGRVNLIGAHLDYNGGAVLPVGLARGTYLAMARGRGTEHRMASLDVEGVHTIPEGEAPAAGDLGWAAYVFGVLREGQRLGKEAGPIDVLVSGDLPREAGLSSSASLEVAAGFAMNRVFAWGLSMEEIADLAWRCETGFVGVKCGIMDPYASALSERGQALHLDCDSRDFEHVPIDTSAVDLVVVDSKKPRGLVGSEFNLRVQQTREAVQALRKAGFERSCLAEFTPDEIDGARERLGDLLFRRARHVATEVLRIEEAAEALRDSNIEAVGRCMRASHESCRTDYEVSCDELDWLVENLCEIRGVHGARLTGAGFGGCVIALEKPGAVQEADRAELEQRYAERFGQKPEFLFLRLGRPPEELPT